MADEEFNVTPTPSAPTPPEEVFDPFNEQALQDPFPAMPEPFETGMSGMSGRQGSNGRSVNVGDGVTLKIQPGGPPPAPKPDKDKPKLDPLAFLSNAKEGKIKVRRLVSPTINSQGYYKATSGERVKVGIGECGWLPVCGPQELTEYIKDQWGGGNYELTHVDQNDKKISVGVIELPQKPKPIEDVDDEENEFDDVPIAMQPGLGTLDPLDEHRLGQLRRRRQYVPGLPPLDDRLDRLDHLDGGYDPRRRAPAIVNSFRPSDGEIEAKKELDIVKQRLETERQAREAAEKERVKEQHVSDLKLLQLKVEEAAKQAASGKSAEAGMLKTELDSLKREIERARAEPKTDPMASFFQLMQLQQKEQALRWEQEREEQRRRDEALRGEMVKKENKEKEDREKEREEQRRRDEAIRAEITKKEEREKEERRRLEEKEREEIRRMEELRREDENRRREEERARRDEERARRDEELRRLEAAESKRRDEERVRREEEYRVREDARRAQETKEQAEREERRRLYEEERDRREEERRRQEAREAAEREERSLERERAEKREEDRKREQNEFMRMLYEQQQKAVTQVDPFSMVQKVLSLANNIKDVGGGGDPEEESTAVQLAKAAIPAMAAIAAPFLARAEQQAAAPAPQQGGTYQPQPPQLQARPQPQPPRPPQPPKPNTKDQQKMVSQYAEMLNIVVKGHKDNKDATTVAAEVKDEAVKLGATQLLGLLKTQTLDSLFSFINMAKTTGLVGGMNAQTLDSFVTIAKTETGAVWVTSVMKELAV